MREAIYKDELCWLEERSKRLSVKFGLAISRRNLSSLCTQGRSSEPSIEERRIRVEVH
jgi:hypothetical protein